MIYQKDWFMRQIAMMIQAFARLAFQRDTAAYEAPPGQETGQAALLHRRLLALLEKRRINEAEDLLFAEMTPETPEHFAIALDFYDRLNALGDDVLEEKGFSREEIERGLRDAARAYGVRLN